MSMIYYCQPCKTAISSLNLVTQYVLSHRLNPADAIVAATALVYYICSEARPPPRILTPRPPLLRREGEKSLGDADVPKPPSLPKRRGLGDEFKGGTNLRTDVVRSSHFYV